MKTCMNSAHEGRTLFAAVCLWGPFCGAWKLNWSYKLKQWFLLLFELLFVTYLYSVSKFIHCVYCNLYIISLADFYFILFFNLFIHILKTLHNQTKTNHLIADVSFAFSPMLLASNCQPLFGLADLTSGASSVLIVFHFTFDLLIESPHLVLVSTRNVLCELVGCYVQRAMSFWVSRVLCPEGDVFLG